MSLGRKLTSFMSFLFIVCLALLINCTWAYADNEDTGNSQIPTLSALETGSCTLSPSFTSTTTSYFASVPFSTNIITVTPTATEQNSIVTVNGTVVNSGQPIDLALNTGNNSISIIVTTLSGSSLTYTIYVNRLHSTYLSNLVLQYGVTSVPIVPTFSSTTNVYTTSVDFSTSNVTLIPTAEYPDATITVNGITVSSGGVSAPISLNMGTNNINVVVSADGVTQTYTIAVIRQDDLYLSGLLIKNGKSVISLTPSFNKAQTFYTGFTGSTTSLSVTSIAETPDDVTLTVNNIPAASGVSLNIPTIPGTVNPINIVVTSKTTGVAMTYNVNIIVEGSTRLSNLALQSGTTNIPITPVFQRNTTAYIANTSFTTANVTVIPTAESPYAVITVNGTTVTNGQSIDVALNTGINTISVVVAPLYGTPFTYTVNVNRAHSTCLSNMTLQSGSTNIPITPAFSKTTNAYMASVDFTTASITVSPTAEDTSATITVNGTPVTSGDAVPVNLNVGTNTISVVITANGVAQQTYTITVTRQVDLYLSNLQIKMGKSTLVLTPSFIKTQTSYTGSSARGTSLSVTATAEAPNDVTLTVNNVPATSGTRLSVPITPGAVNAINVVVTSRTTGASMTYCCSITVAS